jgi:hypothetical protein
MPTDKEDANKDKDPPKKNLPKLPQLETPPFEPLPISAFHVEDNDGDDDDDDANEENELDLDGDFEEAADEPLCDDDAKAFRLALSCIYLPIHSQIDTSRKFSTCTDLVNSVTKGFGYAKGKGSTFERYWKDFEDDCFPSLRNTYNEPIENRAKDVAIEALRQRRHTIETDTDTFYTKSSFSSEKEYNSWKSQTLSMNSFAIQSAQQARQKRFECNVRINVEDIKLGQNKTLFGICR